MRKSKDFFKNVSCIVFCLAAYKIKHQKQKKFKISFLRKRIQKRAPKTTRLNSTPTPSLANYGKSGRHKNYSHHRHRTTQKYVPKTNSKQKFKSSYFRLKEGSKGMEQFLFDRKFCFRIVCLNLSRAGSLLIT